MHARLIARCAAALLLVVAAIAGADGTPRPAPELVFASVEEARAALVRRDEFVDRLSEFDRSSRLGRAGPVSTAEFLALVARSIRPWPAAERAAVEKAYDSLRAPLDRLALPWPAKVLLIHTTGEEESGAAYTRGEAIVLPPSVFSPGAGRPLAHILAHELFHVLSRNNPALRERVNAAIGFRPCGDILLPSSLRALGVTNPDAPRNDYCMEVELDGARTTTVPVLYATRAYDPADARDLFAYLALRLLVLEGSGTAAHYDNAHPRLVKIGEVERFWEQVGVNTDYILGPEEILADNFARLFTGPRTIPSPDVLARIEAALRPPDAATIRP